MRVTIDASLFTPEDNDNACNAILDLSTRLTADLNIQTLDEIVIPEDFTAQILSFQAMHGLQEVGHTDSEEGRAMGKTMHYKDDSELVQVIFLDKSLAVCFFRDDEELKNTAIHLLHHELCHVHDTWRRSSISGFDDIEEGRGTGVDFICRVHANVCWSEYISSRLSVQTVHDADDLQVPFLLDMIPHVNNIIIDHIDGYRRSGDVDGLFKTVQLESSKVLKIASIVIGNLQGLNNPAITDLVLQYVQEADFISVWEHLWQAFQHLMDIYPSWLDYEVYENLSSAVLHYWNTLGIYPRDTLDGGLYISVP